MLINILINILTNVLYKNINIYKILIDEKKENKMSKSKLKKVLGLLILNILIFNIFIMTNSNAVTTEEMVKSSKPAELSQEFLDWLKNLKWQTRNKVDKRYWGLIFILTYPL